MSMKKQVSEKSLELNICAELIRCIRSQRGCEKAVWLGMTQQQERKSGLDEMVSNARGFSLMLQFKAPEADSKPERLYKFKINMDQHTALMRLARFFPKSVHYVLPLYSKWDKVTRLAPMMLIDTWLMPVACIPIHPSDPRKSFTLNFDRTSSRTTISARNLEIQCSPINAVACCIEGVSPMSPGSSFVGLTARELTEWFEDPLVRETHLAGLFAMHLRGAQAVASQYAV